MATNARARETIASLRHSIAGIEGRLAERLEVPDTEEPCGHSLLRHAGRAASEALLSTGAEAFDAALGGGLPLAALTEIHTAETRNAGPAAAFALGLCARLAQARGRCPILWIGTAEIYREAGLPYAPGIAGLFGIGADRLLLARAERPEDALWIAGEAAGLTELAAVVLELRGAPKALDLTATRRLHRRALLAGRPVLLLRHAGPAQSTAAPVRLSVEGAPARPRATLAGPLPDTIGDPAFTVSIGKSRAASHSQFLLEWTSDERTFQDRTSKDSRFVVPLPPFRPAVPAAAGPVLAFRASEEPAGHLRPAARQHAGGRRAQRTG